MSKEVNTRLLQETCVVQHKKHRNISKNMSIHVQLRIERVT